MPNMDHGANVHPFDRADMQFKQIPGVGASTEVALVTLLGTVLAGQTLSIKVNGVEVSTPFNTNAATTVSDLATAIAAESSVTTAVPAGQAITCTAAVAGESMQLTGGKVTSLIDDVDGIIHAEITTFGSSALATSEIEVLAYARAGINTNQREWQIRKLFYIAGPSIERSEFAVYPPVQLDRSDYLFSFDGVPQVQELFFSRGATLLEGNTINIDVDGTTLGQAFVTDHQATLDALATQIQGEAGVVTAARRGNHVIEITAATNVLPVFLHNISVTGGPLTTKIEVRETKHGQPSAAFLTFG